MHLSENQNRHFIEPYLRHATRKFVRKNTVLYKQGEMGEGFYFILDGLVKISTVDFKKNDRILDISTSGKIIGEQVLSGMPYYNSATVMKDSILYYFSVETYKQLLKINPGMRDLLTRTILEKVKLHVSDLNVKSNPTENQVAYYLLRLFDIYTQVNIELKQKELANYTGKTRITIYKILKKWEEEGLLSLRNRKINILKPHIIKQYAGPHFLTNENE